MNKPIKSRYQDVEIAFAEKGWINATGIAEKFAVSRDYKAALDRFANGYRNAVEAKQASPRGRRAKRGRALP